MPSFKTLQGLNLASSGHQKTLGQVRRDNSNMIMESTWEGDPQSCIAYLYDYFHDSEPELGYGLHSDKDVLKTPVPVKFIVHSHNSDANDQVSYYIQFKPSYRCSVKYYDEVLAKRYGARFPIGLFCDIPDQHGTYQRYLISEDASRYDFAFNKYAIYPVNYLLRWVEDDGKTRYLRRMWSVERLRNSYNAGIYSDYATTKVENQTVIWLPMNSISDKLAYDDRLIVSAPTDTPITWKISKIENTLPIGINRLVLYQEPFDRDRDYVNLETGEMYANYYSSPVVPDVTIKTHTTRRGEIKVSTDNLKIGGGYKTLRVIWVDGYGEELTDMEASSADWTFTIWGEDASDVISLRDVLGESGDPIPNTIQIKFTGNYSYLTKLLIVTVKEPNTGISAKKELEITSL